MKKNHPVRAIFRTGKILLTGFFVLAASFFFLYPQIFYCEMIRFSSFQEAGDRHYFSPGISPKHYRKINRTIALAEARVDSFYHGKKSKPVFIICNRPDEYRRYCSSNEGAGCSIGTPWGSGFVVLNGQDANVDVASHELSHMELLTRLGWWKVTTRVPQWFNEGLALMLDKRFVNNPDPIGRYLDYMDEWQYYTGGGQELTELRDMEWLNDFFSGGQRQVMLAYMSSGMEVAYWLVLSEANGLSVFLEQMQQGKSFEDAYEAVQSRRKSILFKKLPTNPLRFPDGKKISG
ncbi:hypothetical protein [Dyadobacter sandarakinus]|uniref:Peptidase MA-like domain-containing protein n=1 Tax=Dyadobacter sandarakinus TaxID=2747268 RepID=A0ABX7I802_9BACT|nr:hypothetical protein [Dyadobacter sandarakinus]QRR02025.1 hypothetical protein HWI92_14465 [Dyadobacter sandarakinus]